MANRFLRTLPNYSSPTFFSVIFFDNCISIEQNVTRYARYILFFIKGFLILENTNQ